MLFTQMLITTSSNLPGDLKKTVLHYSRIQACILRQTLMILPVATMVQTKEKPPELSSMFSLPQARVHLCTQNQKIAITLKRKRNRLRRILPLQTKRKRPRRKRRSEALPSSLSWP